MIIKIIGASIIILASTLMGFYMANGYVGRSKNIFMFINALTIISTEISFNKSVIMSILPKLSTHELGDVKMFFEQVYYTAKQTGSSSLKYIFLDTLNKTSKKNKLKTPEVKILENFFSQLGTSDTSNQIKSIENAVSQLEQVRQEADEQGKKNIKLCRVFGFLAGLFVSLILF